MQKQIEHAPPPSMWCADEERQTRVPVASDAERPLSATQRSVARGPKGQ